MYRWIARFSGRAPYCSSKPCLTRKSVAFSLRRTESSSSDSRFRTSCRRMETICRMWSRCSGWKTMMSSTRLRNSGLKTCCNSSFTFSAIRSKLALKSGAVKPSDLFFAMSLAPTFDVMITTVFLKSITRP